MGVCYDIPSCKLPGMCSFQITPTDFTPLLRHQSIHNNSVSTFMTDIIRGLALRIAYQYMSVRLTVPRQ